tara:strand:- start:344 stop:3100 length:2757 start_codon:yes stop_codon:yes gene_type:complete
VARNTFDILALPALLIALVGPGAAFAQEDGRPAPEAPPSGQVTEETDDAPSPAAPNRNTDDYRPSDILEPIEQAHLNRRPIPEGKINFAFDDVEIKDIVPWLAKVTGKIVMPLKLDGAGIGIGASGGKITVIVDEPVEKQQALDMLFSALRMNGIAVIERPQLIILTKLDLATITDEMSDIPVLDAAVDIRDRQDRGTIVMKIFPVTVSDASEIADKISEMKPQYAEVWVDELSNQIIVLGDIGLCQQYDKIIRELDQKWLNRRMHTFRLKWADANEIATNIDDLFSGGTSTSSARRSTGNNNSRNSRNQGNNRTPSSSDSGVELRLTVNVQQNTVTVQTEPGIMEEIATLIGTEWDLPRSAGTSRLFILRYTDPKKIKALLEEVLGEGTSTGGGGGRGQSAQRANATQAISGIYSIDAYPDKNALLVLAKTVESFDFIASIIEELDRPSNVGVPQIIQLKYARAVELSEELNVLLSKPGTNVTIPRPDTGLSGEGFESPSGTSTGAGVQNTTTTGQELSFPWQRGSEDEEQSPESSLIGKVRIVPIVRQNALAVLAPPAFLEPMVEMIQSFDRPRRQVMLSATVVEVDITDQLNLGLKYGADAQASPDVNGQFLGGGIFDAAGGAAGAFNVTINDFLNQLLGKNVAGSSQTSVLSINSFDVKVIIEALAQVTNTRIIQEPRVFTADNEEAVFFSGKEVPIPVSNTTDLAGNNSLNTQFEYRDVGVFLNVRPRITQEGTVDMEISLQLSDTIGTTTVGSISGEIFSRKQVNSHAIVLDGQTVVIGGLLRENERQFKSKIPLLGDIPILGELFKYTDEALERNELIAFITPTVVMNPNENYDNFNRQDLIRLESVSRPLAEQLKDEEQLNLRISERIAGKNVSSAAMEVKSGASPLPDTKRSQEEMDAAPIDLIDVDAD